MYCMHMHMCTCYVIHMCALLACWCYLWPSDHDRPPNQQQGVQGYRVQGAGAGEVWKAGGQRLGAG